jgi:hypothetical protein
MTPHPKLVGILKKNGCTVMFKDVSPKLMYIWIDYHNLTKNKPGQGFEIWGKATQIFEKINREVLTCYPSAELASQSGNRTVTYRVQGR